MNSFYFIAALRGRTDKFGKWVQNLEISEGEVSHSLTTVSKDNLIVQIMADDPEKAERFIKKIKRILKHGSAF